MTASCGFVEMCVVAKRLQFSGHLTRVSGMDAIVSARRGKQNGRISLSGLSSLVSGEAADKCPVRRVVRVTVLRHQTCTGQQSCVTAHVDQRDRAEQRAEELREADKHIGYQ